MRDKNYPEIDPFGGYYKRVVSGWRHALGLSEPNIAAMINALPEKAAGIIQHDLQDFESMHRGDASPFASLHNHESMILEAARASMHQHLRDPNRPLPESCEELCERLREAKLGALFEQALAAKYCPDELKGDLVRTFQQMARKLAKDFEIAWEKRTATNSR